MNTLVIMCVLVAGASALTGPFYTGLFGHSGIVRPDGNNVQFTQAQADNIVLIGPAGVVTRDGKNIQLRAKRSAGFVSAAGNVGYSGILRADGTTDLFDHDTAHSIVLIGPSGIVTSDGRNMQFTDDLKIVPRNKRAALNYGHSIGDSGIVTKSGKLIQLDHGVTVVVAGPSGAVLSNGKNVQF